MKEAKKLSIAEEIGLLMEKLNETEKEDTIQSCIFLIREENVEEVEEELDWDITSTSVVSSKVSILIDQLLAFDLLKYSQNPGYVLTEEGKKVLLKDIPKDIKKSYSKHIEKIIEIGDNEEIIKLAKKKYLQKIESCL